MRGRAKPRAAATLVLVAAAVFAALALPPHAWADLLTPEAGPSENAQKIDTLYKIVFYAGMVVIGLVWAALFYCLWRYRARRARKVVPQISGNTALELGWTAAASAIVVAITIVTYTFLDDIRTPAASGPEAVAEARGQVADVNIPPPEGGDSDPS